MLVGTVVVGVRVRKMRYIINREAGKNGDEDSLLTQLRQYLCFCTSKASIN